jgi:hypothetical protein
MVSGNSYEILESIFPRKINYGKSKLDPSRDQEISLDSIEN